MSEPKLHDFFNMPLEVFVAEPYPLCHRLRSEAPISWDDLSRSWIVTRKLRALLDTLRSDHDCAYVVRCACDPGEDGSGGDTVVDHIRLFPRREGIRWTYRVHEQVLPSLRWAGIPVRGTDLVVRHTGSTDRALRERKLERDARILRGMLAERPDDPFVLFNLGAIAVERREWRVAGVAPPEPGRLGAE
jgi:hypothetical protein